MSQTTAVPPDPSPAGLLSWIELPADLPWLYSGLGLAVGFLLAVGVTWLWSKRRRESDVKPTRPPRAESGLVSDDRREEGGEPIFELTPPDRREADLDHRRQYTERMGSLGVLAGSLAHDFNNILTTILGSADLALEQIREGSPLRASIDAIHLSAQRGAELCRQVLAYSSQGPLHLQTIDLSALVGEMSPLLEATIPKKIQLHSTLAGNTPAIETDITRLQQIVLNLVTRASVAIGEASGTITIATGARDCDEELLARSLLAETAPPGQYAFLEVTDSGQGLSGEALARLFDPLTSITRTEWSPGLSSVPEIVRERGGAILVESMPQYGTTITVLLPEATGKSAASRGEGPWEEDHTWRGKGTVLIADDEPSVIQILTLMLERIGYSAITTQDGREAVEVFAERAAEIDCVILDISMPRLGGEEALAEIRALRPNVPALLASGYGEPDLAARFDGQDVCAFIEKPYTTDRLRRKLQEITHPNAWFG